MAQDAEEALFRNVVRRHLEGGYTSAGGITRKGGDANEVLQEAWLGTFSAMRSFSGGNARAWVLTIVRNTAYTWLKKNRSPVLVQVEDFEAIEHAQALAGNPEVETPESLLIAENDAVRLEAAISALPDPFREPLILPDGQGLDYREIASVTGVPTGTIMGRRSPVTSHLTPT